MGINDPFFPELFSSIADTAALLFNLAALLLLLETALPGSSGGSGWSANLWRLGCPQDQFLQAFKSVQPVFFLAPEAIGADHQFSIVVYPFTG